MTRFLITMLASILMVLPSVADARPVLFPGGLTALPGIAGLGANVVQNGGFEAGSGTTPNNWTIPSGWARDTTSVHGGGFSYRRTSGASSATQTVTLPAGVYKLSGWMNWANIGGAGSAVRLQIDFRPAHNEWFYKEFTGSSNGWQFVQIPDIVVPQDRTAIVQLWIHNNPSGDVRYDDIALQQQIPTAIEAFMLYPNYRGMVFDDHPTQMMRFDVSVNPPSGTPSQYRVRATLREEASGAQVSTQEPTAASSMVIEINGAPMLYDRAYRVRLELLNSGGAVVYQYPEFRVSRVRGSDRTTMGVSVDHKNRILFHGTPTFPLGVYDFGQPQFTSDPAQWRGFLFDDSQTNVIPDDEERRMAGLPINMYLNIITGQLPADRSQVLMDVLQERGVMWLQLANCHQDGTHVQMGPFIADTSDTYLPTIETHPGSAGVYTADECTTEMIPGTDGTFAQYLRIRGLDPDGMTLGVNFANNQLYFWADAVDVLASDPYPMFGAEPSGGYPHNMVGDWTATNRNAVLGARPIMSVLQFFKFTSQGRFPTLAEMRSHAYMAIVEGANGLWWWSLGTQNGGLKNVYPTWTPERTQLMDQLKNVVTELSNVSAPLLADDDTTRLTTVQVVGDSTNQLTLNIPAATIRTRVKVGNSGPLCTAPPCAWIFAYNYTNQSKTVDFTMNSAPGTVKVYAEGGRTITPTGNTFRDTFGAYGAHVYVVQTGSGGGGPVASITSPTNGATVSGTVPVNMSVSGGAAGPKTFELKIDDVVKFSQSVSGATATYNWDTTTYANGSHTLLLTVTDSASATGTDSISVTKSTGGGGTPLTVDITQPTNGSTVSGTNWVIVWPHDAVGTPTCTITVGGIQVAQQPCASSPTSIPWDSTTVTDGSKTLTVTITDSTPRTGSASVNIVVANTPLTVDITQPTNGSTVSGTNWVIVWPHNAQGTPTCTIKVDGVQVAQQPCPDSPTSIPWETVTVSNGAHTLTVTITDSTTRTGSSSVNITVSNGPPLTVDITQPTNGSTVSGINWVIVWPHNAQGTPTCTVKVDGVQKAQQPCPDSPTSIPWNTATVSNGAHTLTVTITDSTPRTGSSSVNINVSN